MITVSKNKRYLEKNGVYFPYLADTAWTAIQRLSREEMVFYLDCRKAQGFNAVQVSALSELDGIRTPNREGQLPFWGQDVTRPNTAYFNTVLFFLDECAKRDMVAVLLPTWGDKFNQKWGVGPEIFTPENAYIYGEYLARLVGERQDIIWMLGGDRPLETDLHREIINQMAQGLRAGEPLYHLMTYHPCGEATSLDFLPECGWLDYHSLQSGHSFGGYQSEKMISAVLSAEEKPCMDAESFYEDFPLAFDLDWHYRFTPTDIRRRIYRNKMVGGCGTVYGHPSVWRIQTETEEEYT
ncbi:MAG: DUF4038 domain-containing protein, partial [Clostridia bacterium]|nr:DUF4038 domain-containing protein [Clostridia bacterium]